MKPVTVVLILALIALLALDVVFVGVGVSGQAPEPKRLVDRAKAWFAKTPRVSRAEMELCSDPVVFSKTKPCAVVVKPSGELLRKLVLNTDDDVQIELRNAPDEEKPVVIKFRPDGRRKDVEVSVRGKGAWLSVLCLEPKNPTPQNPGCEFIP